MPKDLSYNSEGVEINAFFMILKISVSDFCFFYESIWSKFLFFHWLLLSLFLDGIKEKALKHQKRQQLFINSSTCDG